MPMPETRAHYEPKRIIAMEVLATIPHESTPARLDVLAADFNRKTVRIIPILEMLISQGYGLIIRDGKVGVSNVTWEKVGDACEWYWDQAHQPRGKPKKKKAVVLPRQVATIPN